MKISRKVLERRLEIEEILKTLDENVDLIIVEGKRDTEVLLTLGCKSQIIAIGEMHKPLFEIVEEIKEKCRGFRVVVLMDFDEEGEKLNKKIEMLLEGYGLTIEKTLKNKLRKAMFEEDRRRIEELSGILEEEF
ncbi:MAG: hypothetical protein QXY79_00600 [Candidatus Methanomethylicia archaeon]